MVRVRDVKSGRFLLQFDDIKKKYLVDNYHKKLVGDMARELGVDGATIREWRRKFTRIKRKKSSIRNNKIKWMSLIQKAYIAGLLDGEGNISINMFNNEMMYPKVHITNTYYNVLKYLQETTGIGNIHMHMEPNRIKTNRKPTYNWGITNMNDVRNFLKMMLPFIIIKRRQAKLAINLINIREQRIK